MDDAVLSAGSLLVTLVKKRKKVLIITLFTSFGNRPISWDAQTYLMRSGFVRIRSFNVARKNEDAKAMKTLGAEFIHLDYVDGAFRKDNTGTILYPTFDQLYSGTLAPSDNQAIGMVRKKLRSYIKPSDVLYAPLGVGQHTDHLIVNKIAGTFGNKTYYWLDQPYAYNLKTNDALSYRKAFRMRHDARKGHLITCYASQLRHLYPHGIPRLEEVFFIHT